MSDDTRAAVARFYDLAPTLNDVPFYRERLGRDAGSVLELGCGTGRVLIPLAASSAYIHGIDSSEAMIEICRKKMEHAGIQEAEVRVDRGDITDLDLGRRFDWIIAPFRVFQALDTDTEVDGFFRTVDRHLAPGGRCMVNAFRPRVDREGMKQRWSAVVENVDWDITTDNGRIVCSNRTARIDADRLVLYPELIYRRYESDRLVEEIVHRITMRCYYPEEFEAEVVDRGFRVTQRWGGYGDEEYGEGPELVIEFTREAG